MEERTCVRDRPDCEREKENRAQEEHLSEESTWRLGR